MIDRSEPPLVTVVIPMLDERDFIVPCLDAFAAQTYGPDHLDVVVVDGGSTDGSRQIVDDYCQDHRWCRVVENPRRKASAAFNAGIDAAKGEVLILFSAHGEPQPDYVERSVEVLRETGCAGVGGRYLHEGTDPVSSAIGLAMVSPVGMASPHRWASERQEVDTISHPAYDIDALRSVGPFDESLERNSDYELNWRMRQAGHRLLFDPSVSSVYRPRGSLSALARQFWWYGRWKERVVRRHPGSLRPRHLVPPVAVAAALLAPPVLSRSRFGRRVLGAGAVAYLATVGAGVAMAGPRRHGASVPVLAACFPIMHASWGAGFALSWLEDTFARGASVDGPGSPSRGHVGEDHR